MSIDANENHSSKLEINFLIKVIQQVHQSHENHDGVLSQKKLSNAINAGRSMNFSEYINRMTVNYFINNAIPNATVLHPLIIFSWIKISHDGG